MQNTTPPLPQGNATLFVEGKTDQHFIHAILQHCGIALSNQYGGTLAVEKLEGIGTTTLLGEEQIETANRKLQATAIALFIIDANGSPNLAQRRAAFEKIRPQLVPSGIAAHLFLLPDDHTPGTLETLLKRISTDQTVYNCMDKYRQCLKSHPIDPTPPTDKDDIYAYCQANGANPKAPDFANPRHWNLDAPDLDRLKEFLTDHLALFTP